jgi:N utilization substance protein B
MAYSQQKFREIVFQMIFSLDQGQKTNSRADLIQFFSEELDLRKEFCQQAFERAEAVLAQQEEIDRLIAENATSYALDRIYIAEKNILRLAIYEMKYDEALPEKVAISEALRLTKKFSTPEAVSFVNGILDAILRAA